jgi:lipopolysaccharide cholinephosphotransferase
MTDYAYLVPVQDRLKELLDELVKFAEAANVTYILAYGTLLGAFRHKDVIPWDDDIDVVMLREDYQKFVEYFQTHDTGNYILSCLETDRSCSLYAKFVRTNGDNDLSRFFTHPKGLCIDVFPLDDAYGYWNVFQRINEIRIRSMKTIVSSRNKLRDKNYKERMVKHIVRRLIVFPYGLFSDEWLISRAIRLCKKYNGKRTSDLVFYGTVKPMRHEHNRKESWLPVTELPLGGKMYNAAGDYKAVLTVYYGPDYYKMPPEYLKIQHNNIVQSGWKNS